MLFSSTIFLFVFLVAVLFIYFVFLRKTKKLKNYFLMIASLAFYAYGEPKNIILLVLAIIFNWIFGLLIDKNKESKIKSRLIIALMLIYNLGVLVVYKYLGFIVTNINELFNTSIDVPNIALPIGISFFTFQAISYVIDVYRGHGKAQKNILNVGLYLSFFPQLIAGPIVRYETVAEQIEGRKENLQDFSKGVFRFIIGLGKKVLLSNQLAIVADYAFDNNPTSVAFAWMGIIGYALQIYYDFSGYSDMAIGLGLMFGFKFEENFNYPYISKTITEFWRRWHISLSTWFRDYVYIPLGGSRVEKKSRAFFNIFIVWLLTGIWHGASWNFILWGLYFFVVLMIEKTLFKNILKESEKIPWYKSVLLHIYSIVLILFGWVLFRAPNLEGIGLYLKSLFGINGIALVDSKAISYFSSKFIYLVFAIIFALPTYKIIEKYTSKYKVLSYVIIPIIMECILIISIAFLVKGTYNPFIYFNF